MAWLLRQFRPGSLLWLIVHECRLWWRDLQAKWFLYIVGGLLTVATLLLAGVWLSMISAGELPPARIPSPPPPLALRIAGGVWVFLFIYAFIQSMQHSLTALFDRGDLDLLVSSPIPSKTVFASRLLSVAVEVFLGFLLLVLPATLLIIAAGAFQLLGIYPALVGLCLTTASLSMLLALGLVKLVGARRARTLAQVLTMAIAGAFFVSMQLLNLNARDSLSQPNGSAGLFEGAADGLSLSPESWLWFPVRTLFMDVPSVIATLVISGGLVWLTIETLNGQFIQGTQQSTTVSISRRSPALQTATRRRSSQAMAFNQGLTRVFLMKEWRVIKRSPYLISRTLISMVFLIPLMLLVVQDSSRLSGSPAGLDLGIVTGVALPSAGAFLTSSLAVICIAGEEAPDLLKSAPISGQRVRVLKLSAILIPVWSVLALFFVIVLMQGVNILPGLLLTLLATSCTALVRLWNAKPISLAAMMMRQRENAFNDTILIVLENALFFLWIVLGAQIHQGNEIAVLILLGIVLAIMAISYWRSRALGSSLGF